VEAMIKRIYVLDVSYDLEEGKPYIMIWGISEEGERVVVIYKDFRPYFYLIVSEWGDNIENEIKNYSEPDSPIISIERGVRKYYGKEVKVIKVTTVIPESVRRYREKLKSIKGVEEVVEADIYFSMRFSIDMNVIPCNWIEMEVERLDKKGYRVDNVYVLKKVRGIIDKNPPKMKVLAFDIEVYNKYGSPDSSRDPIIIIGVKNDKEEKQFVMKGNDREIINSFASYIRDYDPDIIIGYNSNGFDWPYLLNRTKIHGVKLDIGRKVNSQPNQGVYGHFSIQGRLNVDLLGFAMSISEVKVKSLDNVADYLGVMPREKRANIEWNEIAKFWEREEKRGELLKYNMDDVRSTYLLGEVFLPFGLELSKLTGLPLDQLSQASVGNRVEWYMIREAFKYNEIVPNKLEREGEEYGGGYVFEPMRGIHEGVYVIDFSSMYPNIMLKYNIGPDTLVNDGDCHRAPEVNHCFRMEPKGFYARIIERLLEERKKVKEMLNNVNDNATRKILEERQKALKVMANAMYGYMGWVNARWYSKEGAEAVTAWGRKIIREAAEIAKAEGFIIVYGDTDSLFLKGKGDINSLIAKIEERFELEIKVEKIYKRVFFTKAKKRYAGLTIDGKIDIVGFEAVRGDWAEIAKEVQERVIERLLVEGSVEQAIKMCREIIRNIRHGKYELNKFVIWKSLEKEINQYETELPHVKAAKKAMKMGFLIKKGSKIGFVILRGKGKLSDRAEPYYNVKSISDLDLDYYIDKQVVPAVMRILEYFGVTEKQLKEEGRQGDLTSFFNI
jgi:DNA polymerase I